MSSRTVFESASQRNDVCRTLCEIVSLPNLWGAAGPTHAAQEILERQFAGLSAGQEVYVSVAWVLWDTEDRERARVNPSVRLVLDILDGKYLRPLAQLFEALSKGHHGVATWLARFRGNPMPF